MFIFTVSTLEKLQVWHVIMDHKESYNLSQIIKLYNLLQRGTDIYSSVHKSLKQWHFPKHTGELERGLKRKKTNEVWTFF